MNSLARTFDKMKMNRQNLAFVSGIGCSSRTPGYIDSCTLHTTHGRALAFATGIKHARPELRVVSVMGDGDATAIGGNHFIHAARRNIDITAIVYNNNIYGMTGGQYSPTTFYDAIASTAPYGHVEPAFDIAGLAKAAGAAYVARTTVYHVGQMDKLIEEALNRKGFSVVEVMCYCHTTFGRRQKGKDKRRTGSEYLKFFKQNSLPLKAAEKMPPEKVAGKILTGVLFDDQEKKEYTSRYSVIVDRASKVVREEKEAEANAKPIEVNEPSDPKRWEICLSGAGGQGLLLAGVVLAESAAKYSGLKAVQTQSYGPEARGGASKSEVVIDTKEIHYPKVRNGDILLALTEESFNTYLKSLKKGGIVIADKSVLDETVKAHAADYKIYHLPIVETAREEVGRVQTTNMVALGVINKVAGMVPDVSLENAVLARVPKGTEATNKEALKAGEALADGAEAVSPE
jgi:2-oxoglutarate ferredoxin oxidoreductase subunit beta